MAVIEYEGTDITANVAVSRCVWDAREEGRVPRLSLRFDDSQGLWDSWAPKPGDRISVSAENASATGAMYVKRIAPIAGGYEIIADALPIPDSAAVREWRSTTFRVVAAQLGAVLGLPVAFHGCDDMAFAYVRQDAEGALPVLARVCMLAGCTFDVYDGRIHVCARDWVESQDTTGVLEVRASSEYEYRQRRAYTLCSINQTEIDGVRAGIAASYGTTGYELATKLDDRVGVLGTNDLKRACAGMLACANARISGGFVKSDGLSPYSPGSVCTIACPKAPSLDGRAVVTRVRNDFENKTSKTWWRKIA